MELATYNSISKAFKGQFILDLGRIQRIIARIDSVEIKPPNPHKEKMIAEAIIGITEFMVLIQIAQLINIHFVSNQFNKMFFK